MPPVGPPPLALKAKLFHGLADGSRLSLLEALRRGPHSVTELVEETGLTQPNASNHLRCLLECGLVAREPDGRYARYRLSDAAVVRLLALADELLVGAARGVEACGRYGVVGGQGDGASAAGARP